MSLIVREKCQQMLDAVGLDNLHASLDQSRCLTIALECGQPVVTITGIQFSRKEPSMKEIEYASELFNAFLLKHTAVLREYVSKRQALIEQTMPKNYSMHWRDSAQYTTEKVSYILSGSGKVEITFTPGTTPKINNKIINQLKLIVTQHQQYNKDKTALNEKIQNLTTCNI
jgi:hypothetical protein